MKRQRGYTIIEAIVVFLVITTIFIMGFTALNGLWYPQAVSVTLPPEQYDAVNVVNEIADEARRSVLSSADGTINAAVQTGAASSVQLCTNSSTDAYVTYSVDGNGNFQKTTGLLSGSGTSTTTTIASGVVSLTFTYCLSTSSTYNVTGSLDDSTNTAISWVSGANLPLTAAQEKEVMAMTVSATVTRSSITTTYSTTVRLRNSPLNVLE